MEFNGARDIIKNLSRIFSVYNQSNNQKEIRLTYSQFIGALLEVRGKEEFAEDLIAKSFLAIYSQRQDESPSNSDIAGTSTSAESKENTEGGSSAPM